MKVPFFIYYFLFLAAIAFTDFSQAASATGFGVSPSIVDFTVEKGSSLSRQLIIYNTGADAQFTVVSDNPAITVTPDAGILKETKSGFVTVTATGKRIGRSSSEILISLTPDNINAAREVSFSLGTRVGISMSVVRGSAQSANPFVGVITSSSIVVAGLSAYLGLRRKNVLQLSTKA